jgi:hypothetical protein
MQITFNHIEGFGKITHQDLIYSNPEGILEQKEIPDDALQNGWIPWKGKWYNHRSVRIDLKNYKPSKTVRKDSKKIQMDFMPISNFNEYDVAEKIYKIYCEKNNFNRNIPILEIIKDSSHFFKFKYENIIRGYTFSKLYDYSLLSPEFIQDFTCPKISLGSISQHYECVTAKFLNKKYVYIFGGYESTCIYKCNFHGMEWWTGKEWSKDMALYKKLCMRDDLIKIENYDNNF